MPGPLQVIAVSFSPGSDFQPRVLAELDRLQGRGVLRLLDVIFVAKNQDGTIEPVVVGGDDDDLGALLSSILPLGGGGLVERTGDVGNHCLVPRERVAGLDAGARVQSTPMRSDTRCTGLDTDLPRPHGVSLG